MTIFFVISGFLITTLLLRDERLRGRADLIGFYIRRVFRLMPLYLLALTLFSVAVWAGLGEHPGDYLRRLTLFLTLGRSWSLAIEEKFYFLWPLVAFILPLRWRTRLWTASVLLAMSTVTGVVWGTPGYFGIYVPIIAGCLIAILTDDEHGFRAAMVFAGPAIGWTLVVGIVALILVAPAGPTQVAVGLAVAAALPFLVIAGGSAPRALSGRLIQWAGRRAYAVYLFHPLVGSALDVLLPRTAVPLQVVQLILMTVGSFALAEVLHRVVEQPLVRVGHSLARARLARRTSEGRTQATPPETI